MTATDTAHSPERSRRISDYWSRHPGATYDHVVGQVDAELAVEHAQAAELEAKNKAMVDSFLQMNSCPFCGEHAGSGARDGLCSSCAILDAAEERAEQIQKKSAETVNGRNRLELVKAGRSRRAAMRA